MMPYVQELGTCIWGPASLIFNIYFYLFLYLYIHVAGRTIINNTPHLKLLRQKSRLVLGSNIIIVGRKKQRGTFAICFIRL